VFEYRVLRRIFGPQRDEVTGEDELHILYLSPNIIRQIKSKRMNDLGGTCGTHGRGGENVHGFGGKTRRKETTWKTKT
jgi:hypothetical protein